MGRLLAASAILICLVIFAITVPCLGAGPVEYDDFHWKQEADAKIAASEAYEPNPLNVTSELNLHVHLALQEQEQEEQEQELEEEKEPELLLEMINDTRRDLRAIKKPKGPCKATNPIDRCWRCKPDWANDRFKLVRCVKGFGRKTTGGLGGPIYVVTDNSDEDMLNPKPGTLRHAVIQDGPLWIIFERNMVIHLKQELLISSHKTIDGRGANVQIKSGAGLSIFNNRNIIIHNLRIKKIKSECGDDIADAWNHHGIRTKSDGDAISIWGSSNIWIDHISMSDCEDGLIDIIQGSTAITISNCHMTHHNDVMLFGASDTFEGDKIMQVTVAFNHFGQGLIQRMPRCRWGFVHVVNNDYTHWQMYAIGGSSGPTILSQGNRFIAPPNEAAKEITHRGYAPESVWSKWQWRSEMDLLMNGATFLESGAPFNHHFPFPKGNFVKPRDGKFVTRLTRYTGALSCKVDKPC
ncbi:hypothetical protein L6164_008419 [Bauhinia variegata]|uniref:Uncharacterized protein n=1 Tax=Bauhinia variegata TaxID=167791 RepID=A0ACB9PGP9_BAUVA|nr:hypothetical protein L6164_008419 [Bauhinia variegata]